MDSIPEWLSEMPEALQGATELKTVPDIETLAKTYIEQDKAIHGSIRLPKDDDESKTKFAARLDDLGYAPKDEPPDDYQLEPAGEAQWLQDWQSKRVDYYKELGLTKKQADIAFDKDRTHLQGLQDDNTTAVASLKKEYGEQLPALMEGARKAIEHLELSEIENSPFGANLKWTKAMIEIGKQYSEDGKVAAGEAPTGETLEDINTQLEESNIELSKLMREGKMTEGSPESKVFNAKRQALMAKKYGLKNGQTLGNEFVKNLHA